MVLDLLEIASYVYSADQAFVRGGATLPGDGKDWRREFQFYVPVRCLDLWKTPDVKNTLEEMLHFVSDDYFQFEFRSLTKEPPLEDYFRFDQGKPWFDADEVLLFSGGLDSLAGLCEAIYDRTGKIILVSHRSAPQTDAVQKHLLEDITQITGGRERLLHVPVWVNKSQRLTIDTHQRTRSFLYASLAVAVAEMHNLNRIYFYENGITSSNLAVSPAVIGSRASRTTHPVTLAEYGKLFTQLFGHAILVDNPFFWKTKADVVKVIKDKGLRGLVRYTTSCSHVRSGDPVNNHCGVCSQCVGRRLAILHNSMEQDDPEEMYKVRMPLDAIIKDDNRAMVELIVKAGREFSQLDIYGFFGQFSEAVSLIPPLGLKPNEAAIQIYDLHRRHGGQVCDVLEKVVEKHRSLIVGGEVPNNSLLSMIIEQPTKPGPEIRDFRILKMPPLSDWSELTIEIVGNDAAKLFMGGQYYAATAFDMGFRDRRKNNPNRLWELLCDFAEVGGTLSWQSKQHSRAWKPQDFQRLRKTLRWFFRLGSDPLFPYNKKEGYRTRFQILYDRTVKR
jgi:7-cyano-7-deazaguanine synthase in queuosine biosynthesis